jgi:hypothetical protein
VKHEVFHSLVGEATYFDDLDHDLGPVASWVRLSALEADTRWRVEYHKYTLGQDPVAVVPVYLSRCKAWPNSFYTPEISGAEQVITTNECALIGGRDGLTSSLHVRPDMRNAEVYGEILSTLEDVYLGDYEYLYFPCFRKPELDLIDTALPALLLRKHIGEDARLDRLFGDWNKSLLSKHRSTLRRDINDSARLGVQTAVSSWADAREIAAPLIVAHNRRKGVVDHAAITNFRIGQWESLDDVQVIVYRAWTSHVTGVLVAAAWKDWMDLQEIGISDGSGEERRCIYAQLIAHLPASTGREMGLTKLRAGPAAKLPKSARGAFFHEIESGVTRGSRRN